MVVLYICVKFHENISKGFQVTDQTHVNDRNHYFQYYKGHNYKRRKTTVTVMVLVFYTFSHGALFLCKVSLNISIFKVWSRHYFVTDRRRMMINRCFILVNP